MEKISSFVFNGIQYGFTTDEENENTIARIDNLKARLDELKSNVDNIPIETMNTQLAGINSKVAQLEGQANSYVKTSAIGQPNGVALLNADGKLTKEQLDISDSSISQTLTFHQPGYWRVVKVQRNFDTASFQLTIDRSRTSQTSDGSEGYTFLVKIVRGQAVYDAQITQLSGYSASDNIFIPAIRVIDDEAENYVYIDVYYTTTLQSQVTTTISGFKTSNENVNTEVAVGGWGYYNEVSPVNNGIALMSLDDAATPAPASLTETIIGVRSTVVDGLQAEYATKAGFDSEGNIISETYAKASDVSSTYLTKTDASNTYATNDSLGSYLTKTEAGNTYLTNASLDSYLTKTEASGTYATNAALGSYLMTTDANNTFLPKVDAGNTYLSKSDASSSYLTKTDASNTYLTKSDASNSYLTNSSLSSYLTKTDASNIYYTKMDAENLKKSVSDGKKSVANAITAKGVTTATDASFSTMATNIEKIVTGSTGNTVDDNLYDVIKNVKIIYTGTTYAKSSDTSTSTFYPNSYFSTYYSSYMSAKCFGWLVKCIPTDSSWNITSGITPFWHLTFFTPVSNNSSRHRHYRNYGGKSTMASNNVITSSSAYIKTGDAPVQGTAWACVLEGIRPIGVIDNSNMPSLPYYFPLPTNYSYCRMFTYYFVIE